ncbi:MAG: ATP-binding protein [Candidatus Nanohaloarchaea archaeon]|nr:ATP-binding protein [Candidatus Nanohaloarchaea archaeon]
MEAGDMREEDIEALIEVGEGQHVEFKRKARNLAKEMVAFANSEGGKILIGVDDKGNRTGISNKNSEKSKIQNFVGDCDPEVDIEIEEVDSVLVVHIKESDEAHKAPDGFYLRKGANSQKLEKDEIVAIMHDRGDITFDELINNEFKYPEDFSSEAFEEFIEMSDISFEISQESLLENLGVAKREDGDLVFRNSGVLMFASNIKKFFMQAEIICGAYESEDKANITAREVISKPLIPSIKEALDFIVGNIGSRYIFEGLERKKVSEYPVDALREAIVNAVMHREYRETREAIHVDIFPERVVVRNPGGLIAGIGPEDLGKKSIRRNPDIAYLLDKANLVERMGTGINRMKKAMKESGLPEPIFNTDGEFEVIIKKGAKEDIGDLSKADLNDRQKKALQVIYEEGKITSSKYQELFGVSKGTAYRDIQDMLEKGFIEKKGSGRGTKYIPK